MDSVDNFMFQNSWYKSYFHTICVNANLYCPDIDSSLILAIIKKESEGKPWATRFEPGFYRWLSRRVTDVVVGGAEFFVTKETELICRATSYGLMQILGQVARERGFDEPYLTALCNPYLGVQYGCKQLGFLGKRHNNLLDVVASYNAGSPRRAANGEYVNQEYVNDVLVYAEKFGAIGGGWDS